MNKKISKTLLTLLSLFGTIGISSGCSVFGGGNTDNPVIPIEDKKLEKLSYSGTLAKKNYMVGEEFDPTGLTFIATFSKNGQTEEVDVTTSVTFETTTMLEDTKYVIAKYKYGSTVKACSISGFKVETVHFVSLTYSGKLTKTEYIVGENFDPTGLTFIATQNDGESKLAKTKDIVFNSGETLKTGQTSVVAKYEDLEVEITGITVKNPLSKLTLSGSLTKTNYYPGESLDLTGLTITAVFADGTSKDVTSEVILSVTSLYAGLSSVTASYTYDGITKRVIIDGFIVADIILSDLVKSGTLKKTSYFEGESFDPSGLTFTAIFSNGEQRNVTNTVTFTPSTLVAGTTKVVASYKNGNIEKTVDITGLTVSKVLLSSLSYTGSLATSVFYDGDDFDPTGLTFKANFNNGDTRDVTSSVTFTPTKLTYQTKKVVASYTYNGATKTCDIAVNMDDPYDFTNGIDFNNGIVNLSTDGKTLTYKKESTSEPLLTIKSNPVLANACLDGSVNYVVNRKNSLKFEKTTSGSTQFILNDDFINSLGDNKFSFEFYVTVAINSKDNVKNLTDGKGNIINPNGYQYAANKWKTFVFDKTNIDENGKFLQTNGSTQGTYYLDNFRILTEDSYVDGGTLYFGKDEDVIINTNKDMKFATKISLDNEELSENSYEILNQSIKLKNISNGEHKLSFSKKATSLSGISDSIYFGLYKATTVSSTSFTLSYGSQGYQTVSGFSNVNRVIFNNKSIAFEQSGSNILIPDSTLVECLPQVGGTKQSGTIKLIVVSGDCNSTCSEVNIAITLSGDATVKTSRTYSSNENYHTFGYSATGGGSANDYLYTEDFFMDYKRSGLDNVYDQMFAIPEGQINEDSFKIGGNCEYIGKDFELADKLGQKVYIIDYFFRNKIYYNKVEVFDKNGSSLGIVTYTNTIDDNTTAKTNFKNDAANQLGISSSSISSWKRYQKPIYGNDGYYSDFESFVTAAVNHLRPYINHKSLAKLVICDEPRYYNLEAVGMLYKGAKEALKRLGREDIEIDANLLPLLAGWGYSDGDGLGPLTGSGSNAYEKRASIYKEYLDKFIRETGADYISYDIYPLWDGSTSKSPYDTVDECAYSNLIVAAEYAKSKNIELHVVTEAYTAVNRNSNKNRRVMSANDMRWLCNQLMGFGVTRVSFFTFYNRSYTSSEFRYDQNDKNATVGSMKIEHFNENGVVDRIDRTNAYYSIQGILAEMNEFSDVALNFAYKSSNLLTGNSVTYKQDQSTTSYSKNPVKWGQMVDSGSFSGQLSSVSVDKEYCFGSTLVDKDGNYMYMIQNACDPKFDTLQTDTLTFTSGNYAVIYENGTKRVVNITNKKITLKLSAGHTAFVMVY